jgi:hypothetical protein
VRPAEAEGLKLINGAKPHLAAPTQTVTVKARTIRKQPKSVDHLSYMHRHLTISQFLSLRSPGLCY